MKRVLLQAGHEGRTTGATGAPGEQKFNVEVANKVAESLRSFGIEVKRVNADPSDADIAGDYDLFLAIHYDADIYQSGGGFVDFPEPSTDGATAKSQAIAAALRSVYFDNTGIIDKPSRSNVNTKYYYMWKRISSNTPCVIIECGVGQHKPDDFNVLQNYRDLVVIGISRGIRKGLEIGETNMTMYRGYDLDNQESMKVAVDSHIRIVAGEMVPVNEQNKLLIDQANKLNAEKDAAVKEAYEAGKAAGTGTVPPSIDMNQWEPNGITVTTIKDGQTTTTNYKRKA